MKEFGGLFREFARPWLCATVYLWALELQAVYATDFEPLLDRLADVSAILFSLFLWTVSLCALASLIGLFLRRSACLAVNQFTVRVFCILVSGFYLMRWLNGWAAQRLDSPAVQVGAILLIASIYFWLRRRRRSAPAALSGDLPSWQDCFSFGVVPILCVSTVVVAIKVTTSVTIMNGVAASAGEVSSPGRIAARPLPNVVVIVSDSLRAQSLSVYDSAQVPTPNLEKFAKRANLYMRSHANSTTTGPAMTTLLTGLHPFSHGRLSREIAPRSNEKNLLRILRDQGYRTAAITSNLEAALSSLGLNSELTVPERHEFGLHPFSWLRNFGVDPTLMGGRMYQELSLILPFLGYPQRTSSYGQIPDTLRYAKNLVARLPSPFFLVVHIHEPHETYIQPSFFDLLGRIKNTLSEPRSSRVGFYAYYDVASQAVVDGYRREYELAVRAVDAELGRFLEFLQDSSRTDGTLLIFTADHGESFERGYLGHGEDLYENSTRVPLIIKYPNQTYGRRINELTQTIDIAPTILKTLGIPIPDWMDGHTLAPGSVPSDRATVTVNFKHPDDGVFYPMPTKLAVWRDQYKLVAECNTNNRQLFNLKNDPGERHNLSVRLPALAEELARQIKLYLEKQKRDPKLTCQNL